MLAWVSIVVLKPSEPTLTWPVRGAKVEEVADTNGIITRWHTRSGMPVRAIASGRVMAITGEQPDKTIAIESSPGITIQYSRLDASVRTGQYIAQGERIGKTSHTLGRLEEAYFDTAFTVGGVQKNPLQQLTIPLKLPVDERVIYGDYEELGSASLDIVLQTFDSSDDGQQRLSDAIEQEQQANGPNSVGLAKLLLAMSRLKREAKEYESAIAAAAQAQQIASALSDDDLAASAFEAQAAVYDTQKLYQLALPLFEQSLKSQSAAFKSERLQFQERRMANAFWNVINVRTHLKLDAENSFEAFTPFLEAEGVEDFTSAIRYRMIENRFLLGKDAAAFSLIQETIDEELSHEDLPPNAHPVYKKLRIFEIYNDLSNQPPDIIKKQAESVEATIRRLASGKAVPAVYSRWYLRISRSLGFPRNDYAKHFKSLESETEFSKETIELRYAWLSKTCISDCRALLDTAEQALEMYTEEGDEGQTKAVLERVAETLSTLKTGNSQTATTLLNLGNIALSNQAWDIAAKCFSSAKKIQKQQQLKSDSHRDARLISGFVYAQSKLHPSQAPAELLAGIRLISKTQASEAVKLWATGPLMVALRAVDPKIASVAAKESSVLWRRLPATYDADDVSLEGLVETANFYIDALHKSTYAEEGEQVYRALLSLARDYREFEDAYSVSLRIAIADFLIARGSKAEAKIVVMENLKILSDIDGQTQPATQSVLGHSYFEAAIRNVYTNGTAAGRGVPITPSVRLAVQAQLLKSFAPEPGLSAPLEPKVASMIFSALQSLAVGRVTETARKYQRQVAEKDTQLAELIRRRSKLLEQWSAVHREVIHGDQATPSNIHKRAQVLADRTHLAEALDSYELEIDAIAKVDRLIERDVPLEEVSKRLEADEAAVWLMDADEESFALFIDRSGARLRRLPATSVELAEMLANLRRGASVLPGQATGQLQFDLEKSYRVYEVLLGIDGTELRGAKSLTLLESETSQDLNLALLARRTGSKYRGDGDYRNVNWLAVDVSLRVALSPSQIVGRLSSGSRVEGGLLALGDPSRHTWESSSSSQAFLNQQLATFEELPHATEELNRAVVSSSRMRSTLVSGSQASEASARISLQKAPYTLIVLATHGIQAGEIAGVEEPALLMSPGDGSPQNDGLLTASEVSELALITDIVVLSACNTASGSRQLRNERFSGMVLAFLRAGAGEVVATDWPLFSEVAPIATTRFIRAVDNPDYRSHQAMREALSELRSAKNGKYSHPYFWAGYMLVGAGRHSVQ